MLLARRVLQAGWLPGEKAQRSQRDCLNSPKGAAWRVLCRR